MHTVKISVSANQEFRLSPGGPEVNIRDIKHLILDGDGRIEEVILHDGQEIQYKGDGVWFAERCKAREDVLPNATDIGRAFLNGSTVQFRPKNLADDPAAWVDAKGDHSIEMDVYDYRVKPVETKCSICGGNHSPNPYICVEADACDVADKCNHGKVHCLRAGKDGCVFKSDAPCKIKPRCIAVPMAAVCPKEEREEKLPKKGVGLDAGNIGDVTEMQIGQGMHDKAVYRRINFLIRNVNVGMLCWNMEDDIMHPGTTLYPRHENAGLDGRVRTEKMCGKQVSAMLESGQYDDAVKDRAIKLAISGTINFNDFGIPPDTMDRMIPAAMDFFRKAVLEGHFDPQVIERFNELVREGKIEIVYSPRGDTHYRLRPTPQYRPFTAVEALRHISARVKSKKHGYETFFSGIGVDYHESKNINFNFGDPNKGVSVRTPKEALEDYEFLDGEPFGMREG